METLDIGSRSNVQGVNFQLNNQDPSKNFQNFQNVSSFDETANIFTKLLYPSNNSCSNFCSISSNKVSNSSQENAL